GTKALLDRVRATVEDEAQALLEPLGGSLARKVKLVQGGDETVRAEDPDSPPGPAASGQARDPVLRALSTSPRPALEVVLSCQQAGLPAWEAVRRLGEHVAQGAAALEGEPTKAEELARAKKIEASLERFLNALPARALLARIYEASGDGAKAAERH